MTIVTDRGLTVRPLGNACGAEIMGADLTRDLTPAQVATIQQAWDEHLVLLFRGQNISQDDQLRFAANFGELGARKKAPEQLRDLVEGKLQLDPRVLLVSNMKENAVPLGAFGDGDMWFHIDSGYSERPYKYTFIYGLKLPSTGGNTLFGNMYKAYDSVPERLKKLLTGKRALHVHEYKRNEKVDANTDISKVPHWFHPLFITHPRTGRKSLFVDRLMTARIEGFSAQDSDDILAELYEIGENPATVYEHEWQLGDFVMWDNLATIHARTYFPKEEDRMLRRCTIEGAPVHE